MVKGKARAAGSFLGGLANNPAVVIIALVLGVVFIFRDRISGALGSLGGSLGNIDITLPEIKLPEINFPDFPEFPEIKFPDFNFPEIFGGGHIDDHVHETVENTGLDPLSTCECGASVRQDAFGNVNVTCHECAPIDTQLPSQDPAENIPTGSGFVGGIGGGLLDFLGLTPAQKFVQEKIETDQLPAGFSGGGLSFIGGSIFETPIENLSLSQIIDKFGVTASQAANIKAIAADDFGDFDFGTNTGGGIGSIPALLGLGQNVSNPAFQGLTLQEIANKLTGGNISNF